MGDIALRGNKLTAGRRAGFQSGRRVGHKRTGNTQRENRLEELGRVDSERAWTRHGKRDLRLERHRIRDELKHGGKPWGTGPKPGTLEHFQHATQTPKRKRKGVGGIAKGVGALVKKFKKKKVYPETEDLTHQVGPYVGDVGSEGKRRRAGPSAGRGKSPGRKGGHPWSRTPPGRSRPGTPAPKYGQKPKKYQPAAEGGRIGLKKGGSDKNWIQKATASIKKRGTKGKCTPITKPGCTGRAKALAKTFKKMAAKRKA